jgi:uncharacterized protein YcnI
MTSTRTFISPLAKKTAVRLGAAVALGAAWTGVQLTTADAHVRVLSDSTASGSFTALTFRVPNESDTAGTVKVSVQLPQESPFLEVSTKGVPGWKAVTTVEKLPKPVEFEGTTLTKAVRTVTWTADRGSQIAPGQYQEFSVAVGPLPAAGTVLLPATQTYSDGKVDHWDQPTPASGEEPEYPAPELVVTAAAAGGGSPSTEPSAADPSATEPSAAPAPVPSAAAAPDSVARGLGGAGLVVGAAALVVALIGRRRAH